MTESFDLTTIHIAYEGESDVDGKLPPSPTTLAEDAAISHGENEEAPLTEDDLLLAATLIEDAKQGRNMHYKCAPQFVRSYLIYHKWYLRWGLYFFILVDLALAFFEKPSLDGWAVPYWGTILIEVMCLVYFVFRISHAAYFDTVIRFLRDTKNIIILVVIALTFIDIICYIFWINFAPYAHPVRWSRLLRPLFIVNFPDGRQIRRTFRNIRRTLPEIMNVLILFLLSVVLFSLLALKLFSKRKSLSYPNGDPYFTNFFDSFWDLYVLVTTANNPDVMMPAYDNNKWFALFFVAFIIICLYIFMSIVLAAIYNNYKKNLKNEVKVAVFAKRNKLAQAFDIMKVYQRGAYVVSYSRWQSLMKIVSPKWSEAQIDLVLRVLDVEGTMSLKKKQFQKMADVLQLEISEVKDRLTFLELKFPLVYNSPPSNAIKIVVRHRLFRYFFDFMIFLNAWFIGFDINEADWFFLSIFLAEIILKLLVFGPKEFFLRFWNVFDFFVIGAAAIASIVEMALGYPQDEFSTLDLLLVLRVMRLIKIFGSIQRFKVVIMTIVNIGPSILSYGGIIFVFYYAFAIVGIEIFQDMITYYGYNTTNGSLLFCGNPLLNGSDFFAERYCGNNFNNIVNALVVLFELTVVNQWHVISSGFVNVTNKAARIYFFAFHLWCVVIVMNIFVAFILEAFILEYSLNSAGKLESEVEGKIKKLGLGIGQKSGRSKNKEKDDLVNNEEPPDQTNDNVDDDISDTDSIPDITRDSGLRFHLKPRGRKKVEVLLQQMFEGEIDSEDDGPEMDYDDILPDQLRRRKLTLDAVT